MLIISVMLSPPTTHSGSHPWKASSHSTKLTPMMFMAHIIAPTPSVRLPHSKSSMAMMMSMTSLASTSMMASMHGSFVSMFAFELLFLSAHLQNELRISGNQRPLDVLKKWKGVSQLL
jgi:hypothetical protein